MLRSSVSFLRVAIVALGTFVILLSLIGLVHTNSHVFPASEIPIIANYHRPKPQTRARVGKVSVAANKLDNDIIHRALLSHQTQNDIHGYPQFTAPYEAVGGFIERHKKKPSGAWTKPAYLLAVVVNELEKSEDERLEWV